MLPNELLNLVIQNCEHGDAIRLSMTCKALCHLRSQFPRRLRSLVVQKQELWKGLSIDRLLECQETAWKIRRSVQKQSLVSSFCCDPRLQVYILDAAVLVSLELQSIIVRQVLFDPQDVTGIQQEELAVISGHAMPCFHRNPVWAVILLQDQMRLCHPLDMRTYFTSTCIDRGWVIRNSLLTLSGRTLTMWQLPTIDDLESPLVLWKQTLKTNCWIDMDDCVFVHDLESKMVQLLDLKTGKPIEQFEMAVGLKPLMLFQDRLLFLQDQQILVKTCVDGTILDKKDLGFKIIDCNRSPFLCGDSEEGYFLFDWPARALKRLEMTQESLEEALEIQDP
ncbi:hypothetical protein EDD86DRAFT_246166 [Gorgonomyces haynaldii]|nr:hypothetical protein EDD86DRAFT_246166 [Gorgonomyces haynaldii]